MIFWENIRIYEGSVFRSNFPTLCIPVASDDAPAALAQFKALEKSVEAILKPDGKAIMEMSLNTRDDLLAARLDRLLSALEAGGSLPNLGRKTVVLPSNTPSNNSTRQLLFIETIDPNYVRRCIELMRQNIAGQEPRLAAKVNALLSSSVSFGKTRTNNRHLLRAASALEIPLNALPGDIILCGWGANSRFLNSSSTEKTAATSLDLSRDKLISHELLRQCGLPVPEQRAVSKIGEAVHAAEEIGFPVVVKPRSRDGGVGVTRAVNNEEEVRGAFNRARAEDSSVLIERHVEGKEIRILFVNGQLISVHERVPAKVRGNGKDPISKLVETENARRAKMGATGFSNVNIALTGDTDRCLASQGMTLRSIPEAGTDVRLATVPKARTGGATELVDRSDVHPDVIEAACKAARMFRLDIAGIDYIASDFSCSWKESGGVITEVNAIPQISRMEGMDVHSAFLAAALPDVGKVPAVLIAGTDPDAMLLAKGIAQLFIKKGRRLGVIADDKQLQDELEAVGCICASYANRVGVLSDRTVDGIVTLQNPKDIAQFGMAMPHFDAAVLSRKSFQADLKVLCGPLFSQNIRGVFIVPDGCMPQDEIQKAVGQNGCHVFSNSDDCLSAVQSAIDAASWQNQNFQTREGQ